MTVRTPSIAGGLIAVSSDRMVDLEPGYGVRVSLDTKTWTEVILKGLFAGVPDHITCVGDVFIIWGTIDYQSQTEIMLVSDDGFRWHEAVTDSRHYGPSFAFRKGRFLMATEQGELWQSDGPAPVQWRRLDPPDVNFDCQYRIAASPDFFLAIDEFGHVLKSEHGDHWTRIDSVGSGGLWCSTQGKLIWDGRRFLYAWGALLYISVDGTHWTKIYDGWNDCIGGLASFGDHVVLLASQSNLVLTQVGDTIQTSLIDIPADLADVTWAHDRFIASGIPALYSYDAVHWDTLKLDSKPVWSFRDIAWGNGRFVAVGGTTVCASDDGLNWQQLPPPPEPLQTIIWNGQEFFAMDFNFLWRDTLRIFSSPDGRSWQLRYAQPSLGGTIGLDYAGGVLFTLGYMGAYLWSDDGTVWHQVSTPGERRMMVNVDYISGRWVCAGLGTYVSSDAWTWALVSLGETTSAYVEALVNTGDRLIAVTWEGIVYSSEDGLTWQELTSNGPTGVRDMVWMDSTIVAVCNGPAIAMSKDGVSWRTMPIALNDIFASLARNESRVVAVSVRGSIVVSR